MNEQNELNNNDFITHLQILQNLKFAIFQQSKNINYQQIHIFDIDADQKIDLIKIYEKYKKELSIDQIAKLIVQKYHL